MKRIALWILTAVLAVTLTACSGGNKYDAQSQGFDGYAAANLIGNQLVIKSICDDIQTEDGFQTAATYALFFDTLRYQITSDKTEGLSNGDKLDIELISYNQEAAKELKISFSNTKFTHTVEGTVIDPFEQLTVEYGGVSPQNGTVEFNTLNCPDAVQNAGQFTTRKKTGSVQRGHHFSDVLL